MVTDIQRDDATKENQQKEQKERWKKIWMELNALYPIRRERPLEQQSKDEN